MKTIKYLSYMVLSTFVLSVMTSCEPKALTQDDVFLDPASLDEILAEENPEGYTIYNLNDFLDTFMTEEGTYHNDTTPYRERSYDATHNLYLYSIDTLPSGGKGIYIRGRVSTDDYGGNFYKALVIQQIVDGKQQNLRLSVDMSSASGMYPRGQEILIRCNGLAIGRYANQPQLCVPSYNNNTNAHNAEQKVGWAPGRIPAPLCRTHFHLIGTPDESQLKYDTVEISDFVDDYADIKAARKIDGKLVVIKDIWFSGKYSNQDGTGTLMCNFYQKDINNKDSIGNPEDDTNAAVFGPTTGNVGYPQSRCITDGTKWTLVSTSEYAKYAHYYLPFEYVNGKPKYGTFKGSVRGILGYYMDNAGKSPNPAKWSITICDMGDLDLYANGTGEVPAGTKWGLYKRPDGVTVDLRKEWQKDILEDSIILTDKEKAELDKNKKNK